MSLRIKKGDLVRRIAGDMSLISAMQEGRNRVLQGHVLAVNPKKGTAIVEGLNIYKKHRKPRSQKDPGGIIEQEMPMDLSNLMLCESGAKGKAGRFGVKSDDKGNKVRVLKLGDKSKEVTV